MPTVNAIRHPPPPRLQPTSYRETCNLTGHSDWVWSVAFCPNGREIASGSRDGTVRLWRLPDDPDIDKSAQTVWVAKHGCKVFAVSVSDDGNLVASGGLDGRIVVWCVRTGIKVTESLGTRVGGDSLSQSTGPRIWSVVFSPGSKRVASASGDGVVSVWCALTGKQLAGPFFGHTGSIYTLAFSPDGRNLASSGNDGSIRVWDSYSGSLVLPPIQAHTSRVRSLVWAPDSRAIFTASHDSTIRSFDPLTGVQLGIYQGHGPAICSLDISHDGTFIVSASRDNTVRLWSTITCQQVSASIQHSDWINTVSLSKDGRYLASAGARFSIHIWRLSNQENRASATLDANEAASDESTLVGTTEFDPKELDPLDTLSVYSGKLSGKHKISEYSRDAYPAFLNVRESPEDSYVKDKSHFEAESSRTPTPNRSHPVKRARKLCSRLFSALVFTRTQKLIKLGRFLRTPPLQRIKGRIRRLFPCQHRQVSPASKDLRHT